LTQGMVLKDGAKMSKNKGNTVDPQALVDQYGADTVRLFMMFAAPPEQALEWSDEGVAGAHRFIKRLYAAVQAHVDEGLPEALSLQDLEGDARDVRRKTHETIAKVSDDFARRYTFNTVVAASMELLNTINRFQPADELGRAVRHEGLQAVVAMLAPITPHVCHSLWQDLGNRGPLIDAVWPEVDAAAMVRDQIELVLQVNGKLRARLSVSPDISKDEVIEAALADPNVQKFMDGKPTRKCIYVPGKLVNVVV
ncbi:MAG: class I tRNA ligase family protein, partial [Pseudomonadota bacterium]